MPDHEIHRPSKWSLSMIALAFLAALSIALDGYYRLEREPKNDWWHLTHLDSVGSFFSAIAKPVSSPIPRDFSLDFGGSTLYEFGRSATPSTYRPGITTIVVSDSIWPLIHFACTLIVASCCLFSVWLIGLIYIRRSHIHAYRRSLRLKSVHQLSKQ